MHCHTCNQQCSSQMIHILCVVPQICYKTVSSVICFVGKLIPTTSCEPHYDDVSVMSFVNTKFNANAVKSILYGTAVSYFL